MNEDSHRLESGETSPPWARIRFAAPDGWVEPETYDPAIPAKAGAHVTYLLWMRQVDAEAGTSFHSSSIRLETLLAVQHESQWHLELDARTQFLTLHWLRLVRNGQTINHLDRSRMRLIQRETQLEHLVINGTWTLLLVLEDVRPGDILESAYSYTTHHPIRPDKCEVFFFVPPQIVVGRFRVSVLFDVERPQMNWRSSDDAPSIREQPHPSGRKQWLWAGSQLVPREIETNQPSSYLDYIWVQISDLTHWQQLAARVAAAWDETQNGRELTDSSAFARPHEVTPDAVRALVEHIQDEYRYLSIDLETGGWIPACPAEVARRRYGDCKDLAWLGATVLRSWGVKARPVLVGTGLRERIATLLPMSILFNHAVLEVEVAGEVRWFDLTSRAQGGSYTAQVIGWFAVGLPVDSSATELVAQPGLRSNGLFALRETILLDTRRGKTSMVEQRLWVDGWQADNFRRTRLAQGADQFAEERLKQAQRRYNKARRVGALQWRDDRVRNVCELAEVFEISDVVYAGESGARAMFDVPPCIQLQSFGVPDEKPRRGQWELPFPIELRHAIVVYGPAMGSGARQKRSWIEPEFFGTLDEQRADGVWSKITRMTVKLPAVDTRRVPAYRRELEEFLRATTWRLYLPWDGARRTERNDFGNLPPPNEDADAYVPPADLEDFPRERLKGTGAPPQLDTLVFEKSWKSRSEPMVRLWLLIPLVLMLSTFARSCTPT